MERDVLAQKIDTAVESLHQELVDFACEIFAIPTQNPPGYNYDKCTEAIGNMMKKIGMDVGYNGRKRKQTQYSLYGTL